jgi:hypothetical protein
VAGKNMSGEVIARETHITNLAGEILAAAPDLRVRPNKENVAKVISTCVESFGGGSLAGLAHLLQMPSSTVINWRNGHNVLQLDSLLSICQRIGIAGPDFLTGKVELTGSANATPKMTKRATKANRLRKQIRPAEILPKLRAALRESPPASPNNLAMRLGVRQKSLKRHLPHLYEELKARYKKYWKTGWDGVRKSMKASLAESPPPSVKELAGRLGRSKSSLYQRLPELCHAVAERHAKYRQSCGVEAKEALKKEVREIALMLYQNGIQPSHRTVSQHLSKPGRMSRGEARGALRWWKAEVTKGV